MAVPLIETQLIFNGAGAVNVLGANNYIITGLLFSASQVTIVGGTPNGIQMKLATPVGDPMAQFFYTATFAGTVINPVFPTYLDFSGDPLVYPKNRIIQCIVASAVTFNALVINIDLYGHIMP